MDICGRNVAEGIPKSITVNSNDILESLQEPLVGMVGAIKAALESAPELSSDIAQQGMTLTGGGALLKNLDKLIREETELPVYVANDPLTCVAHGGGKMIDLINTVGEKSLMRSSRDLQVPTFMLWFGAHAECVCVMLSLYGSTVIAIQVTTFNIGLICLSH